MENSTGINDNKRDALIGDLKAVIQDAEDLLKSSGQQAGQQVEDRYKNARAKFETTLKNAKCGLSNMEHKVSARTRDAVDSTDQYVKAHPWQSVGIGAIAGLVAAILVLRR